MMNRISVAVLSVLAFVAAAPQPFTVTTAGMRVVYPIPKSGAASRPAFSVTTGALAVVYPTPPPTRKSDASAFTVKTPGLTIVYPTSSPLPKGK